MFIIALTDTSTTGENTIEYLTIQHCTVNIQIAVKNDLTNISGRLFQCGLINATQSEKLTNQNRDVAERAKLVVDFILDKVSLNKENYSKFINEVLGADRTHYRDIIKCIEKEYGKYTHSSVLRQGYSPK